jgi:RNA polymerase sigma-70 factor (ECF subfamily)
MRDDGDFAAYLVARWAPVVRTLVMLGSPQPVAEDVARSAFARLSRAWTSIRDADDIDAHAYATVLRERRHHRTGGAGAHHQEQSAAATRARLEEMLDRLTPDVRAVLVLRFVAGLGNDQVADALGRPVATVRELLTGGLRDIDLDTLREASR